MSRLDTLQILRRLDELYASMGDSEVRIQKRVRELLEAMEARIMASFDRAISERSDIQFEMKMFERVVKDAFVRAAGRDV